MFKLKKERINFKKKIGSGASGTVYPYQKDADDSKWVVKRMHADDSDKLLTFLPEIVLGFSCDHPYVLPLKGYSIEKGDQEDYYIFLKFPRMAKTLKERSDEQRKNNKQFSEQELVKYFYAMVCAVDYLHKKKIYHRDIKPGNVLLDDEGNAMLSDVGVAKHVGDEEIYQPLTGQGGTVDYTAPELLKDKFKLTKENLIAGDAWSLGLVMLELCMLKNRLFNPYSTQEKIEEVQKSLHSQLKEIYSKKLLELIFKLLNYEPNERIKIPDLKQKLEDEYHLNLVSENLEEDKKINKEGAHQELRLLVESLKQENFQLQNELKEYRSFISQLQSEIFAGLGMPSEDDNLKKLLTNYQNSLKKLKEGERVIINQNLMKGPDEEEKKEPQGSVSGSQDSVSLVTMLNGNQLQNQRAVGLESLDRIKVVFIGSGPSGKTNIVSRLISKPFNEASSATIGASYFQLNINRDGRTLGLQIWDTAGQEKYKYLMGSYFKISSVVVIVYDITVRKSFYEIPEWIELKTKHARGPTILFIVGTKLDRESERKVSKEEAETLARQHGGGWIEVSAKTGENIEELKEKIMNAVLENYNTTSLPTSTVQATEQRGRAGFWGLFG